MKILLVLMLTAVASNAQVIARTVCGPGGPISGSVPVTAGEQVNAQTMTSYTYQNTDCGKLVTHANGGSIAGTLPQANATTFRSGWFMDVQNTGVGTLTITPTTSTIDGAATLVLITNRGARIISNGTNYFTERGGAGIAAGSIAVTTDTLKGDGSGNAVAVTGTPTDCVLVNGSSGACGSAGANAALSNLASVSINTSLLAQTGVDAGSTTHPFRNLFLFGGGSYGTNYYELTGTPTGTRVITIPDATDTLIGKATTDTLSNKTFDTAGTGNNFQINGTSITAVSGTGAVCLASGSACSGGGGGPTAQNDVTASRAQGTVYQNTSGTAMYVSSLFTCSGGQKSAAFATDSSNPPTTTIVAATVPSGGIESGFFVVINNNYYKAWANDGVNSDCTMTIVKWIEWN